MMLTLYAHPDSCKVYLYYGTDSLNHFLLQSFTYNEQGLMTTERHYRYDSLTGESTLESSYRYIHEENKLIMKTYSGKNFDSETLYEYDKRGFLAKESYSMTSDTVIDLLLAGSSSNYSSDYFYDDRDNLVKSVQVYEDDLVSIKAVFKYFWKYDEQNRVIAHWRESDEIVMKETYYYTEDGYTITTEFFYEEGEAIKKTYVKLDDFGRIIKETVTKGDGTMLRRTVLTYSSEGLVLKKRFYDENGQISHTWCYQYW